QVVLPDGAPSLNESPGSVHITDAVLIVTVAFPLVPERAFDAVGDQGVDHSLIDSRRTLLVERAAFAQIGITMIQFRLPFLQGEGAFKGVFESGNLLEAFHGNPWFDPCSVPGRGQKSH